MPIKARWCLTGQDEAESLFTARFDLDADPVPDFIIHDALGRDVLGYPDAVRICLSFNELVPDYNLSDYGISHDAIVLSDRHLCVTVNSDPALWLNFLAAIFERPKAEAFRRDRDYWGTFCEATCTLLANAPVELQQAQDQNRALSQTALQMARIVESRKSATQ